MKSIEAKVEYFRSRTIQGKCIDLVPYSTEHAVAVVRLRNMPGVRHFLNQAHESTLKSQTAWHAEYLKRCNDIFWIMQNKNGHVVGCNRLYDISAELAEKGSLIVEQNDARVSPVALEGDLLVIKLGFDEFDLGAIITSVRPDNGKMQSMNERLGFRQFDTKLVNGVLYNTSRLERGFFQPTRFDQLITYWSKRDELGKT